MKNHIIHIKNLFELKMLLTLRFDDKIFLTTWHPDEESTVITEKYFCQTP